jgi:hypothetical protein
VVVIRAWTHAFADSITYGNWRIVGSLDRGPKYLEELRSGEMIGPDVLLTEKSLGTTLRSRRE